MKNRKKPCAMCILTLGVKYAAVRATGYDGRAVLADTTDGTITPGDCVSVFSGTCCCCCCCCSGDGGRRCLARRWLNLINGHRNMPMTVRAVAVRGGSVSGDGGVGGGKSSGRVPAAFKSLHAVETCTSGGKRRHRRTMSDNSDSGGGGGGGCCDGDSVRFEVVPKRDGDRNYL